MEPTLRSLELSALQNIEDGGSQQIANTLHATAKSRCRLSDRSDLAALERQAEAVTGSFNAQELANTMWASATMGRAPGAGVVRGLEVRAQAAAPTMKAQNVANTLWAYATMGRAPRSQKDHPSATPSRPLAHRPFPFSRLIFISFSNKKQTSQGHPCGVWMV